VRQGARLHGVTAFADLAGTAAMVELGAAAQTFAGVRVDASAGAR
jgi:hypothetical protein